MDTATLPLTSVARVATASPRRYLGQLCKHFEHKLPATYDAIYQTGRIEFSVGVCELEADEPGGGLVMHARAANEADLLRVQDVVARHLERFMFREPPTIEWVRG